MKPNIQRIYKKEGAVADIPNAITAKEDAPIRFDIPMNILDLAEQGKPNNLANRSSIAPMISCIKNINKSYDSLKSNVERSEVKVEDSFIQDLREFCKAEGITSVGFTRLPHHLVFKDKAVLFENAIVLTMEMDKDRIALAPHIKTGQMVMQTYNSLGIAANNVAIYLRKHGYSAQASHPLGGIVLYPPLAKEAGLGWNGRHGLLITPEAGPRVRIAAVFTNISNLPFTTDNPHGWIPEYCASCGLCIKACPPKSLHEKPIHKDNGLMTHNDTGTCFPYFTANYGCTVCIKVCPFGTIGYDKILTKIIKKDFLPVPMLWMNSNKRC